MKSAFDDLLYLTSRDLYVAILEVLSFISRLINRVQKEKRWVGTNPCIVYKTEETKENQKLFNSSII